MSRRTKEQQRVSTSLRLDEDDIDDGSADDELARELEEERQKILAAANQSQKASTRSDESSPELDEAEGSAQHYLDDDTEVEEQEDAVDEDDSEDEWKPPVPATRSTRRSKRGRQPSSSDDSGDGDVAQLSGEEEAPVSKKSKKSTSTKANSGNGARSKSRAKAPRLDPPIVGGRDNDGDEEQEEVRNDSFDEEAERVQAEVEAAAAWADVRRRKEAAQAQPAANGSNAKTASSDKQQQPSAPSLTAWLGKGPSASSSVSELASSLPMPTTCSSAQIVDRNSLFVGYVYPLTTASSAYISTLLSHLIRVVHPTVSIDLLPPQFANAPANKRGSSHDMYAYRVFELKRGRTGLAGPDDFSLQEDKEDDGERWGGDRVLRVARDEGASDVLVVVSRWYGGELLGPVRFDHIENAARAALVEYMTREEVEEFRQRIQWLDRKIARVKAKLAGEEVGAEEEQVEKYEGLTLDKGQRLWLARQKALEALLKRVDQQQASQELANEPPAEAAEESSMQPHTTDDPPVEAAVPSVSPPPQTEHPVKSEPSPRLPTPPTPPHTKPEPTDALPLKHERTPSPTIKPDPDDLTGWDDLA